MDTCPACGTRYKSSDSNFCSKCGAKRPVAKENTCTNPLCEKHGETFGSEERFCDLCGALTTYGRMIDDIT